MKKERGDYENKQEKGEERIYGKGKEDWDDTRIKERRRIRDKSKL